MTTNIGDRYFEWLYNHIGGSGNPLWTYWRLAEQLHNIEFTYFVPNDDNRARDGLMLRDEFCDHVGSWGDYKHLHDPCTVLEMLIALAKRADYEADGLGIATGLDAWFWEIVSNIKLDSYSDAAYLADAVYAKRRVSEIISDVLERRYDPNGHGGLFPLRVSRENQRNVEIWYQLSAYIIENGDFE